MKQTATGEYVMKTYEALISLIVTLPEESNPLTLLALNNGAGNTNAYLKKGRRIKSIGIDSENKQSG